MTDSDLGEPFQWSLARREQLGGLAEAPIPSAPCKRFYTDLRVATARTLAFAMGARRSWRSRVR